MKSGFFIMKLWQTGNVGSCNIAKIKANPKKGYASDEEAKTAMKNLHKNGDWELTQSGYSFTVTELFW
ncbi:MAG TPA: RNA-binding protein [Candidatus Paceibacterota bacterium]|nr:RNA-binding protein [Candidatus Paceibacterota bacterium]